MGPVRILLGDDHTVVRQGLCKILEEQPAWHVVAQASDGREARDGPPGHGGRL